MAEISLDELIRNGGAVAKGHLNVRPRVEGVWSCVWDPTEPPKPPSSRGVMLCRSLASQMPGSSWESRMPRQAFHRNMLISGSKGKCRMPESCWTPANSRAWHPRTPARCSMPGRSSAWNEVPHAAFVLPPSLGLWLRLWCSPKPPRFHCRRPRHHLMPIMLEWELTSSVITRPDRIYMTWMKTMMLQLPFLVNRWNSVSGSFLYHITGMSSYKLSMPNASHQSCLRWCIHSSYSSLLSWNKSLGQNFLPLVNREDSPKELPPAEPILSTLESTKMTESSAPYRH